MFGGMGSRTGSRCSAGVSVGPGQLDRFALAGDDLRVNDVPGKGDLRYLTIRRMILIGALLAGLAVLLSVWLDWGVWPWVVAAVIFLYLLVARADSL
jgi:hypothetical protein